MFTLVSFAYSLTYLAIRLTLGPTELICQTNFGRRILGLKVSNSTKSSPDYASLIEKERDESKIDNYEFTTVQVLI